MPNNSLVQLSGLWRKTDKSGNEYFVGQINKSSRLIVFPNNRKQKDADPDLRAYITATEPRPDNRRQDDDNGPPV